jgi:arginyl-tRNA synthetase
MNPKDIFAELLNKALNKAYGSFSLEDVSSSVSYCDPKFGDFSTNIAFRLSKTEAKSPAEVAEVVINELNRSKNILKAEFLKPGFINVIMSNDVWADYISSINDNFAKSNIGKGKSIQLEFISANPTGPLVLVNAWQGYYGDILANIYNSQGFKTSTEYLLNDGGNQIVSLGRAIQQALGANFEAEISENLYRGEYIDNIAEIITTKIGSKGEVLSSEPLEIGSVAADLIVETYIKPDLVKLGVKYDSMFSEGTLDIKKTLSRLDEAGLIKNKDGAVWLDGSKVGLDKDQVLVRSYDKGESYFLKDIAYQLERLEERGYDNTITIVGPDHHGQAIRLVNTLKALGHEGFTELSTQTIRLIKDGKEFKMSKRKGNYVLLSDFLDEVPTEAARFYFAMRDTNTHMDFDIDLIKEHSAKNPVYYSLYAYARACSIEEKAKESGITSKDLKNYEISDSEKQLAIQLSKVEGILAEIVNNHKVHQLLHQAFDIAKAFHEFYEKERVVGADNAGEKLAIIEKFKTAYEAIFAIIGVELLNKM